MCPEDENEATDRFFITFILTRPNKAKGARAHIPEPNSHKSPLCSDVCKNWESGAGPVIFLPALTFSCQHRFCLQQLLIVYLLRTCPLFLRQVSLVKWPMRESSLFWKMWKKAVIFKQGMTGHVPVFSCVTFRGLCPCGLSTLLLFFDLGILDPVCVNVLALKPILQEHFDRQIKGMRFSSAEFRTRVIPH